MEVTWVTGVRAIDWSNVDYIHALCGERECWMVGGGAWGAYLRLLRP